MIGKSSKRKRSTGNKKIPIEILKSVTTKLILICARNTTSMLKKKILFQEESLS
ncbi:hypothetical protein [Clostridium sp.]|uniref:hypothetical protein n=1 Tax=Clostridium sp. TaxID=1506 RepID=UPI003216F6C9